MTQKTQTYEALKRFRYENKDYNPPDKISLTKAQAVFLKQYGLIKPFKQPKDKPTKEASNEQSTSRRK